MTSPHSQKGFTLIEIIVSVGIFVVVILIAVGAVLNAVDANRKAQNINVIVNNLNLAIESMVRDLRTGHNYQPVGNPGLNGYSGVKFVDKENRNVTYSVISTANGSALNKSGANGAGTITGDEITLDDASFTFEGLGVGDGPERILLHLKGRAGAGKSLAEFNIETVITSRILETDEFN